MSSVFSSSVTRRICRSCQSCATNIRFGVPYVDRPEAGAVAGSHVGVQSLDSGGSGRLAVLLVHIVGAGPRVITDPDAEVLHLQGVLLGNLKLVNHPF